ncbi:MAG: InlB B-repeat-containing protein [Acetatifactor sp.]|nr:InlB B-repeat-containing protein [Acetatifactor sp.]
MPGDVAFGARVGYWLEKGTEVIVGELHADEKTAVKGMHKYDYLRTGEIPVYKWEVNHSYSQCIHTNDYSEIFGEKVNPSICGMAYNSGWFAYCGDCGEVINFLLVYGSKGQVSGIKTWNADLSYYSLCPFCRHLEQASGFPHTCREVDNNMYRVDYRINNPEGSEPLNSPGYIMGSSYHMYDNTTTHNGKSINPIKNLAKNLYRVKGYAFAGWSTSPVRKVVKLPEGASAALNEYGLIADEAEILNLCEEDYQYTKAGNRWSDENSNPGVITLYAVWVLSDSTLIIDPGDGTYNHEGTDYITPVMLKEKYGETVKIKDAFGRKIKVTFNINNENASFLGTDPEGGILEREYNLEFSEWQLGDYKGEFDQKSGIYTFSGPGGSVDRALAVYKAVDITLPSCISHGSDDRNFIGWFTEREGGEFVGNGEDILSLTEDITLYAHWGSISLRAENNYTSFDGVGAVDLSWKDSSGASFYNIYRKDGTEQIKIGSDGLDDPEVFESFIFSGKEETFKAPVSGIYEIDLSGSSGGSYSNFKGGAGERAVSNVFLNKDETLKIYIGSANGENPNALYKGGKAGKYGAGGAASAICDLSGKTVLVAAGGGGATSASDGQGGGIGTSLRSDLKSMGADGGAGGGGGFRGGNAGEYTVHNHTYNGSRFIQGGVACASSYGGCYTRSITYYTSATCKVTSYPNGSGMTNNWMTCSNCHRGFNGNTYSFRAVSGYINCGSHGSYKSGTCPYCGTGQGNPYVTIGPHTVSTPHTAYALTCSYGDGEIIASKPGYGGVGYGSEKNLYYRSYPATNQGDGKAEIKLINPVHSGNEKSLTAIARDKVSPSVVSSLSVKVTEKNGEITVTFDAPKDFGTGYFWRIEGMDNAGKVISEAEIFNPELITDVIGYKYIVSKESNISINAGTKDFVKDANINIGKPNLPVYLHVAAVDKAGNVGETSHILLSANENIEYEIIIEDFGISGDVYRGETGMTYVKAGGDMEVDIKGRTSSVENSDYFINTVALKIMEDGPSAGYANEGDNQTFVTKVFDPDERINASSFIRYSAGEIYFYDLWNTGALRDKSTGSLHFYQHISPDADLDGKSFLMYPAMGVTSGEGGKAKEISQSSNGKEFITGVICDGRGPAFIGIDNVEAIINDDSETGMVFKAVDELSGLSEFILEISDFDLDTTEYLYSDDNGIIRMNKIGFSKNLSLTFTAKDRVGNVSEKKITCGEALPERLMGLIRRRLR